MQQIMHKFFVPKEYFENDKVIIKGDDVNHITKVLRMHINDIIKVNDNDGNDYICTILSIDKKNVICSIDEKIKSTSEPSTRVYLYQGLPKSTKMDIIIQKCTEIGVYSIIPVLTERVVVKTIENDINNKLSRWQRIAEEAAKQSNRGIVPKIGNAIDFKEAINQMKSYEASIIPYEMEKEKNLKGLFINNSNIKSLGIFIGPEGGFSKEEIEYAKDNGIISITLGPRILRTETAGLTCLAIVLYETGNMGGLLCQ